MGDIDVKTLSVSIDRKPAKVRKDYKFNIRKILSGHDAVAGLTLEEIYSQLTMKFGNLSDQNKRNILGAISSLEESKEIFQIGPDASNPKFRLVDHPEFRGFPQDWKVHMTPKKIVKPRSKIFEDDTKMLAFHITCICGHYHVQYMSQPMAKLGKKVSFLCECGWKTTLEK